MPFNKILSTDEQRIMMAEAEAAGLEYIGPCPSHLSEAWIDIPLPDGKTNRTKLVWPKSSNTADAHLHCPLVIYFHGGGYSVGTPDAVLAPARGFASLFSCIVACPSLNQIPEELFPAPVKSGWEVTAWLSDINNLNEGVLKDSGTTVDLTRGFVVGGLSSGGATAAVIGSIAAAAEAGLTIEEFTGLTPLQSTITGIFSGIPFLASDAMLPESYRPLFKSRDLEDEATRAMREDLESRLAVHSPWFSPINLKLSRSTEKFPRAHPPKVYIYGGELDGFRDDSVVYAKWLEQLKGVEVRASVLKGEGHTGWVSLPWEMCHSRQLKEAALDGMGWLLGVEWDRSQELPI
ncbi:alpha/beta-hydrolase [Aspergillus karnatakaensis]|uniref:alpha/beta-hydrolase n=1 Tax=Aspergillus karnatakaensis TaxID=1810916 RepID=UPI003CCDAB7E